MTEGSSEYFERIKHRVNVALLAEKLVVVVGVGTVGSQIARELANGGVGRLRLVDGDRLEDVNLVRHVLSREHVGVNKAKGLAGYLARVPNLRVDGVPSYVDDGMSDRDIDGLLGDADLIVAATDDRTAQRRIGRRALSLDIPALFPALYAGGGGEVFVQRSPRFPCFLCWDGFRPDDAHVRGVSAVNAEVLSIIEYSVHLCHGVLDRRSSFARALAAESAGQPLPQLFIQHPFGPFAAKPVPRRPGCPSCAVGPADAELRSTSGTAPLSSAMPVSAPVLPQAPASALSRVDLFFAGVVGGFWGFVAAGIPASIAMAVFRETTVGYVFFFSSFVACAWIGAKIKIRAERADNR